MSAFGGKADIVADHEKKRDPRSGEINRAKPMEVDNNARLEKRTASRVFAVSPKKLGSRRIYSLFINSGISHRS